MEMYITGKRCSNGECRIGEDEEMAMSDDTSTNQSVATHGQFS
jgi:hypothetical protein